MIKERKRRRVKTESTTVAFLLDIIFETTILKKNSHALYIHSHVMMMMMMMKETKFISLEIMEEELKNKVQKRRKAIENEEG